MNEIINKARELCYKIEELPASEQQTNLSIMASDLSNKIEQQLATYKDKEDKLREYMNSGKVDDSIAIETINEIINKENL